MVTLAIIAVPALLVTLLLEVHEGRLNPVIAGLDGGIALGAGTIALHACGAL